MTQISFYHLTKTTIDEALPKLLEKVLESDSRAIIKVSNDNDAKHYDDLLWSLGGTRIVPHGVEGRGDDKYQPVLISKSEENVNDATFLVTIGRDEGDWFSNFDRSLYIFNGNDNEELEFARSKWKKLKDNKDLVLKYYFQNEKGNWQEK